MTLTRLVAIILLVTVGAVTFQPAPAEAIEGTAVLVIVGVAIAVILIVAVVVIANVRESQRGTAAEPPPLRVLADAQGG